ncbi:uncharacterized protein LOC130590198 [Beta vulgaris subsp. vulgaris]|uniref:uncharacterized protein LOC130590198 n=1 Tax=Beta vulgaris subsp. vulgaris TaxID=3555 RepID=UPI0025478B13|nr:uncharacterized protein LOC130590198 [Beta vulgaris subsp. vulgaris]
MIFIWVINYYASKSVVTNIHAEKLPKEVSEAVQKEIHLFPAYIISRDLEVDSRTSNWERLSRAFESRLDGRLSGNLYDNGHGVLLGAVVEHDETCSHGPNLAFNRFVPRITEDEARVAIYCQTITMIINGDRKQVLQYWNHGAEDLSDQHFRSTMGLSPAYPQGRDFGLRENKSLTGTTPYASVNTHLGIGYHGPKSGGQQSNQGNYSKPASENPKQNKPAGGSKRRFNPDWYDTYGDWLEYSIVKDAAYCRYCYLFKYDDSQKGGGDAFVTVGWSSWNKKERLDIHVGECGSSPNQAYTMFETLKNEVQIVKDMFNVFSDKEKEDYRNRLEATVECIKWLLRMNLAFRGHNESTNSKNRGNFVELLKFLPNNNEDIDKVVLENAPKNLQLVSPEIQKDIVHACSRLTVKAIMEDLGDDIFERFLGIIHVPDTTTLTLKAAIDFILSENGLTVSRIYGQGYDGASNMQGEFNGLKTLVLKENKSAFSIHCFAHQLQLTLVAVASKQGDIASFFSLLSRLMNIVGASCRRHDVLRAKRADEVKDGICSGAFQSGRGLHQETSLQRPADTRWRSHYKTLNSLLVMLSSLIDTLEYIDEEGIESEHRGEARIMKKLVESFDFVFPLHLMFLLLGITNDLSMALQRKDQDILNAIDQVNITRKRLQSMRDDGWGSLLDKVSSFCDTHENSVPNMNERFTLEGKSKRKAPMVSNLHRYRAEIFYATIDFLLQEINNRFDEETTDILLCVASLSPINSFQAFDTQKLLKLALFYPSDFSTGYLGPLENQLGNYIVDMRSKKELCELKGIGELSSKLMETGKHVVYPMVYFLLKLALILPVATSSVERAFSSMNYVKNKLRNRMGDQWMNDCLVICGRLRKVLPELIMENQSGFVFRRYIVHNIMVLQDLIKHYGRKQAQSSCILTIDLQKAYDTVS